MADNTMTIRLVVKEIAQQHRVYATFMPKPLQGQNGSGMHLNTSLFRGSTNAFFDPEDVYHLLRRSRRATSRASCSTRRRLRWC